MKNNSKKDGQQCAIHNVRCCAVCQTPKPDKGRAMDGRRAYRCKSCGNVWTEGMQGRQKRYSEQRDGYQFADSRGKVKNVKNNNTFFNILTVLDSKVKAKKIYKKLKFEKDWSYDNYDF